MALTVSFAPAAPAAAARPTRAAAPAAADSPEGFDAVLARTADGRADACARPVDGADDLGEQEEPAEPVDVSAMTVCLDLGPRIVPPPEVMATTSESEVGDTGDGLPVDTGQSAVGAPGLVETADAPRAITSSDTAVQDPPTRAAVVEGTQAPASPHARRTAASEDLQIVVPVEQTGKAQDANASDPPVTERNTQPTRTTASPSSGPAKSAAPRAEARAAAQVIVAEAMSSATVARPETAGQGSAVATAPLLPVQATTGNGGAVQGAKARPTQALVDAPPAGAGLSEVPVQAESQGRRESGHAPHEQGLPQARTPGLGHAGVPASMIFPGQATFAAAMERAVPLAEALPPGFAGRSLETVVPQVVRSMHMQVTAGGGDMTLTLTPDHLGTVTIELRVDQQRVSASLGADTAAVRGWIAAHEQDLKAGLADLGLQLDEFVVRDEDPRQQKDQADGQPTPQRRKRDKAEEPVFEVQA